MRKGKIEMASKDWLVDDEGNCIQCPIAENWEWPQKKYRLYRFLTDIEDIIDRTSDQTQLLLEIRPLVRRLLTSSDWLQGEYLDPDPKLGWSVLTLYDEIDFPLTIQTVAWLPGKVSPIHNHAAWGIVALISGTEKNILWKRSGDRKAPDRLDRVGEQILEPGDIISFTPDAIHSLEAISEESSISFNIYGETNYENRFEFDPITHSAENF